MTVRQKIGLVSTTGTLRLSTCPLYSHQHPFSSILRACMGGTSFLINISPYFCSASFLFPHVTASNFQHVCRKYVSTLSVIVIVSWAVDGLIEMTCMLPDVTMHKSSSVCSQLQWFPMGLVLIIVVWMLTFPYHPGVNCPFTLITLSYRLKHTDTYLVTKVKDPHQKGLKLKYN